LLVKPVDLYFLWLPQEVSMRPRNLMTPWESSRKQLLARIPCKGKHSKNK
jgi:hypothetical protein